MWKIVEGREKRQLTYILINVVNNVSRFFFESGSENFKCELERNVQRSFLIFFF